MIRPEPDGCAHIDRAASPFEEQAHVLRPATASEMEMGMGTDLARQDAYRGPWYLWVEDMTGKMVLVASAHDTDTAVRVAEAIAAELAGRRVTLTYPDNTQPVQIFGGLHREHGG